MDVTPYVLIVFFKLANAGGTTSHDFIGKQHCEQAAAAISEKWEQEKSWASRAFTICVPK